MSARDQKIVVLKYVFERREGVAKKCTFCTLVKMTKIVNDPLGQRDFDTIFWFFIYLGHSH